MMMYGYPQTMSLPPGMQVPAHLQMQYTMAGMPPAYGMPDYSAMGYGAYPVQLPAGAVPPPQVQAAFMQGQPLQETKTELDPAAAALKAQRKKEKELKNKLELYGNTETMNLERILHMNIQASPYFKELVRFKTYHEVVDEIYYQVSNLEPWLPGAGKTPSTAWCLLYKCFVQKLTRKQMDGMLKHPDSPYIRAIGFLYLRYTQDPKTLWTWFEPFLLDEESFTVKAGETRPTTIGRFVRELLTEKKFCDQLLPRLPVTVIKDLEQKLREFDKAHGIESDKERRDDRSSNERDEAGDRRRKRGSQSPREGDRAGSSDRDERRDRDRGRDRDDRDRRDRDRRDRDSDRRDRDREDRDRDRDRRDRDRDRRDRDRDDRDRRDRSPPSRKRSRSRSPTPTRRVRSSADSAKRAADLAKLREIYGSSESSAPSGTTTLLAKGPSVTENDTIIIGRK